MANTAYVEGAGFPGMRVFFVAALLVVGFAGCTSTPSPEEEAAPTPTFTSLATLSNLPPPAPTSDTMYLLDAPHMVASPPSGPTVRTPVPSLFDDLAPGLGSASFVEWSLPRDQLGVLEGNLTFWVEVRGSVVNPNVPFFGGTACFWNVMLLAYRSDGGYNGVGNCADEPNVVPEGVREFRVEFGAIDISDVAGDVLAVRVSTSGIYSDGATVDLLAGSPEHASRLALRGLTLPLDTQTYL